MFWFLKKQNKAESDSIVEEKVEEKFTSLKKCRFSPEDRNDYQIEISKNSLFMKLKKKNMFAWCENSFYRYEDFIAEADFSFTNPDAYSSAGLVFRKGSEFNYYYFLVSTMGYFRVDCVFNGNPLPLVDWTLLEKETGSDITVKAVGLGGYFDFYVNGNKVCSINDETVSIGGITFCSQNYSSMDESSVLLRRFYINSIPSDVETAYSDKRVISVNQKMNLVRSLYERGKFEPAAVQMESIIRNSDRKEIDSSFYSLYGEILLNLKLHNEALRCFDLCLEENGENIHFILEKGNLLYQTGRYLDLYGFLSGYEDLCRENPVYWDLKGHSSFYLGNFNEAADYYIRACSLDPEIPVYYYNAAGSLEKSGKYDEAIEYYKKALLLFYRNGDLEDTESLISLFDSMGIKDRDAEGIRGKLLFSENKFEEAEKIFQGLIENGDCGSDIYYLSGLYKYRKGDIMGCLEYLKKSSQLEPECALYHFKLAEIGYLNSMESESSIEKALEYSPDDVWINNLAGLISMKNNKLEEAEKYFSKAFRINNDLKIALNYAEVLSLAGKGEEALNVLDSVDETEEVILRKGEILVKSGQHDKAYNYLELSYTRKPDNPGIMKNLAEVCYLTDKISRCEEILYQLEAKYPDNSVYNMIGNIARLKGEYGRAESAYLRSLEIEEDPVVFLNYIEGICEKQDYFTAYDKYRYYIEGRELPENLLPRSVKLLERIRRETETVLSCSTCGREWTVRKNIVMKKKVRLIGDPLPESPAGRCPSCGKIYCVECALEWISGPRFSCPDCNENLKLSDDYLRHIVSEYAASVTKSQLS